MGWIFGRDKKKQGDNQHKKIKPLYEGERGIHDLTDSRTVLRVWLPLTVDMALSEVAKHTKKPGTEYLREFFALYLYGKHDFERMRQDYTGLYYDIIKHPAELAALKEKLRVEEEAEKAKAKLKAEAITPIVRSFQPLYSRALAKESIPDLGKNIVPLKVYINNKIKGDLQALADKAGVPLSRFIREILVSHLLGHSFWPERFPDMQKVEEADAVEWELS